MKLRTIKAHSTQETPTYSTTESHQRFRTTSKPHKKYFLLKTFYTKPFFTVSNNKKYHKPNQTKPLHHSIYFPRAQTPKAKRRSSPLSGAMSLVAGVNCLQPRRALPKTLKRKNNFEITPTTQVKSPGSHYKNPSNGYHGKKKKTPKTCFLIFCA